MKINFNFDTMKFEGLDMEQIKLWERLYPEISIFDELMDMIRWLDKVRDTKKANKRNWKKFIINWLTRAQRGIGGI